MAKKKATMKLTGDELRSKLAERARRMPWRQFSKSLLPDEHRELTFFGGSAVDFWRTYNANETLRRQTTEQPPKSHAQIKREVDEVLAGKAGRADKFTGAGMGDPRTWGRLSSIPGGAVADFSVRLGGLSYRVTVSPDQYRGGYRALLISEGVGIILDENGSSPSDALTRLARSLRNSGDTVDSKIAEEIARHAWFSMKL